MSRRRTLAAGPLGPVRVPALLPVAEAAAAKRVFGSRALQQGSTGRDVRVLQDFLTRWGVITHVDGALRPGHRGPRQALGAAHAAARSTAA